MISVVEIIDEFIAEGHTRPEAIVLARAELNKRKEASERSAKEFAANGQSRAA